MSMQSNYEQLLQELREMKHTSFSAEKASRDKLEESIYARSDTTPAVALWDKKQTQLSTPVIQRCYYVSHYVSEDTDKLEQLSNILTSRGVGVKQCGKGQCVLIFVATKRRAEMLAVMLEKYVDPRIFSRNPPVAKIFTDVEASGVVIYDVDMVINYDMPNSIDIYVHCIGRVWRAGKNSTAVSFLTSKDIKISMDLYQVLTEASQEVPLWLIDMAERSVAGGFQAGARRPNPSSFGRGVGGRGERGRGTRGTPTQLKRLERHATKFSDDEEFDSPAVTIDSRVKTSEEAVCKSIQFKKAPTGQHKVYIVDDIHEQNSQLDMKQQFEDGRREALTEAAYERGLASGAKEAGSFWQKVASDAFSDSDYEECADGAGGNTSVGEESDDDTDASDVVRCSRLTAY